MNKLSPWSQMIRRAAPILMALFTLAVGFTAQGATLPSTNTVSATPNPSIYGTANYTFTATVTGDSGTPMGDVQFKIDGTNYGAPIALSPGGTATLNVASDYLAFGTHSIVAEYTDTRPSPVYDPSIGGLAGGQVVNKRPLTVTATGIDKVYDATTNVMVTLSSDKLPNDVLTLSPTNGYFTNANVGNGKVLFVDNLAIAGPSAGNYVLITNRIFSSANVTPKDVSYVADIKTRFYGRTNPVFTGSIQVFAQGDGIGINGTTGQIAWACAANTNDPVKAYPIVGSGVGNIYGNYNFLQSSSSRLVVTNAPVIPYILVTNMPYAASPYAYQAITYFGLIGVQDWDTSTNNITNGVGLTAAAINLPSASGGSGTTSITNCALWTITSYNTNWGTAPPTWTNINALWATNVGVWRVALTNITLAGPAAANYYLSSSTNQIIGGASGGYGNYPRVVYGNASIVPRPVTPGVTIGGRVYDGTRNASISGRFLTNRIPTSIDPDSSSGVQLTGGTGFFETKTAGTAKPAYATNLVLSGSRAFNYTFATNTIPGYTNLVTNTAYATATITQKPLTPNVTVFDRDYDGTTNATILGRSFNAGGVVAPDDVSLGASGIAYFLPPDAALPGIAKPVGVTGLVLSGLDKDNYSLTSSNTTTSATIWGKQVTVTAIATNKVYDASRDAQIISFTINGLASNDVGQVNVSYSAPAQFDTENVGTNKTVTVSGLSLFGPAAVFYSLASNTVNTAADITSRTLNVFAQGISKPYDGNTNANVTLTSDAPPAELATNLLTLNYTSASFQTPDVGTGKNVNVSGIWLGGVHAGNYLLANTSASTTADITNRQVTVVANAMEKCIGQPDPPVFTYSVVLTPTTTNLLNPGDLAGALTRVSGESVGTYPILQGSLVLTNPNYAPIVFVSTNFTIKTPPDSLITGPATLPQRGVAVFSDIPGMHAYSWSVTGNAVILGPTNAQTVTVQAGSSCDTNFTLTSSIFMGGCSDLSSMIVSVTDATPPTLTGLTDALAECGTTNAFGTPVVTDACSTNVTLNQPVDSFPVEVTTNNLQGWVLLTNNVASIGFANGPAGAPMPTGSAFLTTTEGFAVAQMDNTRWDNTLLRNLTELSYRTYRTSGGFSNNIYMILTVDNGVDSVPDYLTFEPRYQNGANPALPVQGGVVDAVWQKWDALAGGWFSDQHAEIASPGAPGGGNVGVQTLATYLGHYPNAKIVGVVNGGGGVLLGAGNAFNTWENFSANVDGLIVGVSGVSESHNFEAISGLDCVALKLKEVRLRTWTANDGNGNQRSSSQIIVLTDSTPPMLSGVPTNITVECSQVPPPDSVTASDLCAGTATVSLNETSTKSTNSASLGYYSYTITRTWSTADACGNSTSATQVITVRDTTPPAFVGTPNNLVINCGEPMVFTPPSAQDNCTPTADLSYYTSDLPLPGACPGTFTVTRTWRAVDISGNISAPATQTITVVDVTPPVLVGMPANATVECSAIPAPATVTALDGCDANPTLTFSQINNQGTNVADLSYYNYTITRTWTARDACSNSVVSTQTITVRDSTAPSLAGQGGNYSTNCPINPTNLVFQAPTATDNCAPVANIVITAADSAPIQGACSGAYAITRTWTARDVAGNTNSVSQTVSVIDNKPPTITQPANVTVACGGTSGTPVNFVLAAQDDCDSAPVVTSTPPSGHLFPVGTTTVTSTARDACGNVSASVTFTVTVRDLTGPLLTIDDLLASCTNARPLGTNVTGLPMLTDGCGSTATLNNPPYVDSAPVEVTPGNPLGWSILTGGTGMGMFTNGPAQPPLPAGSVGLGLVSAGFSAIQATAWGGLYLSNITELRFSTYRQTRASDEAVVLVLYVDTDANGAYDDILYFEPRYQNQNALNGTPNQGLVQNLLWQEWDALAGGWWSESHPTVASPGPGASALQNYVIRYPLARIVNPPIGQGGVRLQAGTVTGNWLNFNGNVDRFIIGVNGVSAAYDFELTPGFVCSQGVASDAIIRTWSARDAEGNPSSHSQTILMVDNFAPDVTSPTDTNLLNIVYQGCSTDVLVPPYSATPRSISLAQLQGLGYNAVDSCGSVTVSYVDVTNGSCPTVVTRTFTATDGCGNSASMVPQVNRIFDTTAPIVTVTSPVIIQGCDSGAVGQVYPSMPYIPGGATSTNITQSDFFAVGGRLTENCSAFINYADSPLSNTCPTAFVRTWTVTDNCGNSSTNYQTYNINDTTPVAATAPAATNFVGCGVQSIVPPFQAGLTPIAPSAFATLGGSYFDACGSNNVDISYFDVQTSAPGVCPVVVTRTFRLRDQCRNSTDVTQLIRVLDTGLPVVQQGTIALFYPTTNAAVAAAIANTTAFDSDGCSVGTNLVKFSIMTRSNCTVQIEVRASDACGNLSPPGSAIYTTSVDDIGPVLTLPANITTNAAAGLCSAVVSIGSATATDTCQSSVSSIVATRLPSGATNDPYPVGTTVIQWVATDSANNSTTNLQTVTVIDTQPPTFPAVSTNLAIGWWRGDSNALDSIGQPPNNGILVNAAGYDVGRFGAAFSLNMSTNVVPPPTKSDAAVKGPVSFDFVSATANGVSFNYGDFSITAWVKTSSTNALSTVLAFDGGNPAVYVTGSGRLQFYGASAFSPSTSAGLNNGQWHQIAVVRQGGSILYFQDGTAAGTGGAPHATAVNPSSLMIGWDNQSSQSNEFRGLIDEVTLYNRALSSAEIAALQTTNTPAVQVRQAPQNITVVNDAGQCGAIVSYTAPVGTDQCSLPSDATKRIAGLASGSLFPVGVTTVTYEVTDASTNTAQTSFTVTVLDTIGPVFTNCPANIIVDGVNPAVCGAIVTYTAPGATDLCPGATIVQTQGLPSGSTFPAGVTRNDFVVSDASGNQATCSFTVTVVDKVPPIITCPGAITLRTGTRSTCDAIGSFTVTATDNCGPAPTVTSMPPSGSTFPVGTTLVTSTAVDAAGNSNSCTFTVTVLDDTRPVISGCPANITLSVDAGGTNCQATVSWTAPLASDNCVVTSFTSTKSPGSVFPVGVTPVTYTATDLAGNQATCSFTVTVTDGTPPAFTGCPANIVSNLPAGTNCSMAVSWTPPSASDSCTMVTMSASKNPDDQFPVGVSLVTYMAWDTVGNTNTCTFTVTVVNTNGPVFTAFPADVNASCPGDPVPAFDTNVVAVAPCGGPVTVTNLPPVTNVVSACVTTITSTWRASDQFSNVTERTQTITIGDITAPTVTKNGNPQPVVALCYPDLQVAVADALAATSISDNCAGTNLTKFATTSISNCTALITVLGRDGCGNETAAAQGAVYTTRIDSEVPVLGAIEATQGATNVKDPVNCSIKVVPGDVIITVVASDNCGLAGGQPSITLTNGAATSTATFVSANGSSYTYKWTVTGATQIGTWGAVVAASDYCNTVNAGFTLCVDNSQITGLVQLQGFTGAGSNVNHARWVTFVATTNHPALVPTNTVLKTWTLLLTNVAGDTFSYILPGVPGNANGLSAKTDWNLRSKLPVALNINGQASNVDFNGAKVLRGGDYAYQPTSGPLLPPDNVVQLYDYLQVLGSWLSTTDPRADVDGNGSIGAYDYFALSLNWLSEGDPQ